MLTFFIALNIGILVKVFISNKNSSNSKKSNLDLDGKQPKIYDRQSRYETALAISQLDLDGLAPKVSGKLPYLNNLPR